jgi:hypothetical protein
MTLDEALAAVAGWAEPKVFRGEDSVTVSTSCGGVGVQVLLEDGEQITAVELWAPGEGRRSDVQVLLDGDDVFTTPAERILARARERGRRIRDDEPGHPLVPGVSIGFTRETSQDVPRDASGTPLRFNAVLVAAEDYYDFLDSRDADRPVAVGPVADRPVAGRPLHRPPGRPVRCADLHAAMKGVVKRWASSRPFAERSTPVSSAAPTCTSTSSSAPPTCSAAAPESGATTRHGSPTR